MKPNTNNGKMINLQECTRVEVISKKHGRAYVNMKCSKVQMQMQDGDKTLKIFIE